MDKLFGTAKGNNRLDCSRRIISYLIITEK